jgi:nucleotide-binding universal stress UspA family protein
MKRQTTRKRSAQRKPKKDRRFVARILVPIDFSESSKDALKYAVRFAKQFGAELILVHIVEPTVYPADFSFAQVGFPNIDEELRNESAEKLSQLVDEIMEEVSARSVVRTGKAFLEIIGVAKEEAVDLIIMATHGHTGVEHILFGSTAEKVVRKAPCPVLTVPPRGGLG